MVSTAGKLIERGEVRSSPSAAQSDAAESLKSEVPESKSRFYRPELDALRFLAFFGVFLFHDERLIPDTFLARQYNHFADALGNCLCLFFFLSSYLITELLLEERERSGSVHLVRFYIRRILRIWPLYYLGLSIGIALSHWMPHRFLMPFEVKLHYLFLVGFITPALNPMGLLWSISVEELFYLVWPVLCTFSQKVIWASCLLIVPISLLAASISHDTWFNPLVHFLFFAGGGMTALCLHSRSWTPSWLARAAMFIAGLGAWRLVSWDKYHQGFYGFREALVYVIVQVGTLLIFLSVLNIPRNYFSKRLIYLGRISFGLYVFHYMWLRLFFPWSPVIFQSLSDPMVKFIRASLALACTLLCAAISYKFYEKPFLRLKQRFQ